MQVTLTVRAAGVDRDVEIATSTDVTVAELAPLLTRFAGSPIDAPISSSGRPLPPSVLLGDSGLRSGSILTLGPSGPPSRLSGSVLQLRVVAGPDCGQLLPLPRGRQLIGRAAEADLTLADPDVSRRHAELSVHLHGIRVRDLNSTNGTWLNGSAVGVESQPIQPGELLKVGSSLLTVLGVSEPPAAVTADDSGLLLVHRPPKVAEPVSTEPVRFPAELGSAGRPRLQLLAALLPTVAAVVLAVVMHSYQFLAFAALSPLTMLASGASDRRQWRRGRGHQRREFAAAEAGAEAELRNRLSDEVSRRRREFADAADVLHAVLTPDRRLWERRPGTASFLAVRLGVADQPAETTAVRSGQCLPSSYVEAVPAVVALTDGALGLAGPLALVRGAARWVIAQVLALHSPREVSVIALLDGDNAEWSWLRWCRAAVPAIATQPAAQQQLVSELASIIAERRAGHAPVAGDWQGQWLIVLIDRARTLAAVPGLRVLLEDGPSVGITAVCVDEDLRLLPPSCRATAAFAAETGSLVRLAMPDRPALPEVIVERVSLDWSERIGRGLAALRDADHGEAAQLPPEVRLVELLDLTEVNPQVMAHRWSIASGASASTPIGVSVTGPVELDLLRDGPHVLIAGSTGSGKSELLRSLVAGFAARHPPDEVAFVLIDYKGGAAFAECAQFPHTLALVTDLDGHLTARALTSLEAELRRREAAFADACVGDLENYRHSPQAQRCPLPRLILVVDEFAFLAEELPNFLSGLIGIAQRGRSLGLHLVLATQRPAGVVSPEIKANIALRIALRVTDAAESSDIIGCDQASRISKNHPGRAIAQLASGLVEFQTARTGQCATAAEPITIRAVDSWNNPLPTASTDVGTHNDLTLLVQAMSTAMRERGRPTPARPWLPPLPDYIGTQTLAGEGARFEVRFGLTDDPSRQAQFPATHELSRGGSIGFIGGPRSGRSTALTTMLGQAARQLRADELHLYLLDCAGRGLEPLAGLPHCGAALGRDDPRSAARLIARLADEVTARQRRLAELGVSSVAEAHLQGIAIPVMVLAIDGWEGLTALSDDYDAGRTVDAVLRLLRDGSAVGLSVLVTGDRALLGIRIAPAISRKLVMALTDRSDYAMAGLSPSVLPARFRPGQAIELADGLEIQLAGLAADPSPASQRTALHRIIAEQPAIHGGPTIRIRALPESASQAELGLVDKAAAGAVGGDDQRASSFRCLLGIGGDDATAVACDLFAPHSRFLIAGPTRSGRSMTALVIARQGLAAGLAILIAAPPRSPLANWAERHSVEVLTPEADSDGRLLRSVSSFNGRLLMVDDAELFNDTPAGDALLQIALNRAAAVVATCRVEDLMVSFRGLAAQLRRDRTGLLLQPGPADGELLGIRTSGHRAVPVPGRGLLVTDEIRRTAPDGCHLQVAI